MFIKKDRSNYTLQFNCDVNMIKQLMQNYLSANDFKIHEKNGEQYYRAGDQMLGYKGLTYSISGNNIAINAWLDGTLGNFSLEQNIFNMMATNYKDSLSTLFNEIIKLNNGGINNMNQNNNQMNFDPQTGQPLNQNNNQMNFDPQTGQSLIQNNNTQPIQNNTNQFVQTFQDESLKKKEKMCEIGFWISILGLLASFCGIVMGIFVYILDFYFASQGLKTRKKGKAIATIVLSIISILVIIFQLMFTA